MVRQLKEGKQNSEIHSLKVRNTMELVVFLKQRMNSNSNVINVEGKINGAYFLEITSGEQTSVVKLVKSEFVSEAPIPIIISPNISYGVQSDFFYDQMD